MAAFGKRAKIIVPLSIPLHFGTSYSSIIQIASLTFLYLWQTFWQETLFDLEDDALRKSFFWFLFAVQKKKILENLLSARISLNRSYHCSCFSLIHTPTLSVTLSGNWKHPYLFCVESPFLSLSPLFPIDSGTQWNPWVGWAEIDIPGNLTRGL